MAKKNEKNFKLFKNFIHQFYFNCLFAGIILIHFLPDAQKGLVKIKETRLSIAKKLGIEYDLRSKAQAFFEISQNNPNLAPSYYFNSLSNSFLRLSSYSLKVEKLKIRTPR